VCERCVCVLLCEISIVFKVLVGCLCFHHVCRIHHVEKNCTEEDHGSLLFVDFAPSFTVTPDGLVWMNEWTNLLLHFLTTIIQIFRDIRYSTLTLKYISPHPLCMYVLPLLKSAKLPLFSKLFLPGWYCDFKKLC
jgi:hypothetical protein